MRNNRGATLVRLLTAIVMLPVVLALVWIPQLDPVFVLFIAVLVAVGMREFFAMVAAKKVEAWPPVAIVFGVVMVAAAKFSPNLLDGVFVLGVIAVAWTQVLRGRISLPGLSLSLLGLLYVGWMPAHFVMLHDHASGIGPSVVTLLIVVIALSDSGAYFVGKSIGKRKLAPTVSPNKTWEGSIGGVVAALIGVCIAWYLDHNFTQIALPGWALWQYGLAGILLAVAGQIGDLVESMMKRDAGVKDSGNLLPGHGGILDRCDGFLFAGPVLYYLLAWLPVTT